MGKIAEKHHQKYHEVFCEVFSYHKRKSGLTYKIIATRIGAEAKTVESWGAGNSSASVHFFFPLAHIFGADFLNDLLIPYGFGGVREADSEAESPLLVLSEITNSACELSKAMADGRIDHTEKKLVVDALNKGAAAAKALAETLH